ncbi:TPA: helix-turn-helix domain-containing protein [Legionella pneumophila]|nr:helix-turn-helix domain-containing protein [Legionella pneumophila subsp. pneumophila]HAU1452114.1 helix-turn-helix domain-containing protein [Legionella pneumophila]HAU1471109.1 helix-turn-helix domain-containing protein [Legionella pneumophila]
MKTMNILQASQFLGVHKESLRRMAVNGQLPGVKIGRRWIFIEQDLVMHIRNKYSTCDASQGAYVRSNKEWHSTKEMEFGGLISGTKEKEYAKVLGLK